MRPTHLPARARALLGRRVRAAAAQVCVACRASGRPGSERTQRSVKASERQRRLPAGYCPADALSRLPRRFQPLLQSVCANGAIELPAENEVLGQEAGERSRSKPIRRLFLQTDAGMCNRLRALVSGICWAEDLSCSLVVSWPYHPDAFCRFEDLFEIGSLPPFVTVTACPLKSAVRCKSPAEMELLARGAIDSNTSTLSIVSSAHFHRSDPDRWIRHLRNLRPTRDAAARVSKTLGADSQSRIGVHVRAFASELRETLQPEHHRFLQSPLSAFLERMKKEDHGTIFVVATDDDDVRSQLEKEMAGRCLFPARVRDRRSREGMKEGLVDFLSLARCTRILGSYWSSFSILAADYGGAELEIVRSHSEASRSDEGMVVPSVRVRTTAP